MKEIGGEIGGGFAGGQSRKMQLLHVEWRKFGRQS